jgi:hypothetical protein
VGVAFRLEFNDQFGVGVRDYGQTVTVVLVTWSGPLVQRGDKGLFGGMLLTPGSNSRSPVTVLVVSVVLQLWRRGAGGCQVEALAECAVKRSRWPLGDVGYCCP